MALAEYRKSHLDESYELRRFKGLGEQSVEELEESAMAPATRTLKQITMEDATAANRMFNDLMGTAVAPRKVFIEQNAWRANIDG